MKLSSQPRVFSHLLPARTIVLLLVRVHSQHVYALRQLACMSWVWMRGVCVITVPWQGLRQYCEFCVMHV